MLAPVFTLNQNKRRFPAEAGLGAIVDNRYVDLFGCGPEPTDNREAINGFKQPAT
jgi:hypothetical protein